ncbi:MAG: hypothetical protein IT561_13885 [Alphaproteobacteria bacterium]|nr:hypothetical protein [Alphaproteobacteria bacterium]
MAGLDYADAAFDLPPQSGRVRPYVVAATPRSGSTLLAELLRSTGVLGVPGEYLHTGDYVPRLGRRLGFGRDGGPIDIDRYLPEVVRRRTSPGGRFGIKIHFRHLQPALRLPIVRAMLRASDFVHIRRRDRLGQAISYAVALDSGEWSRLSGEAAEVGEDRPYDDARLRRIMSDLGAEEDGWQQFYEANGIEPALIWYEDLTVDPVSALAPLLRHLGVPDAVPMPDRVAIARQSDPRKKLWRARTLAPLRIAEPGPTTPVPPMPTPAPRTVVFTVCALNYLPRAALLLESLARHAPGLERRLIIADRPVPVPGLADLPARVEWAETLDLPDLPSFAFRYQLIEFATAVKGFALRRILSEPDVERALFLDPDTRLYAPLDGLLLPLDAGADLALTPHATHPSSRRAFPTERDLLQVGVYNLGVLAARRTAATSGFLDWLCARLERDCVDARADGLYVDQRFFDLAPAFVDRVAVVRDPALNVAYWNLDQRRLARDGTGFTIDGRPLVLFHFSGLDPQRPQALAERIGTILPEDGRAALAVLATEYARDLAGSPFAAMQQAAYGYGRFADGGAIPDLLRFLFRRGCEPFAGDPFADLPRWLAGPAADPAGLSRLMALVWRHSGPLRRRFDLADPAARKSYRDGFAEIARGLGLAAFVE